MFKSASNNRIFDIGISERVAQRCNVKKIFLEISQNSQLYLKKDSGTGALL